MCPLTDLWSRHTLPLWWRRTKGTRWTGTTRGCWPSHVLRHTKLYGAVSLGKCWSYSVIHTRCTHCHWLKSSTRSRRSGTRSRTRLFNHLIWVQDALEKTFCFLVCSLLFNIQTKVSKTWTISSTKEKIPGLSGWHMWWKYFHEITCKSSNCYFSIGPINIWLETRIQSVLNLNITNKRIYLRSE